MRREEAEKLLGGWAAGALTDAERRALLEAALEDQALFNQLAAEQPLKETLEDPAFRRRIHAAAEQPRRRVWTWGLAGSAVAASILVLVLVRWDRPESRIEIAEVRQNAPVQAPERAARRELESPVAAPEAKQTRKFELPAPRREKTHSIAPPPMDAPEKDLADVSSPPPPAVPPPPAEQKAERRGVVGGAAGGVIGGVMSSPPRVLQETIQRPQPSALRASVAAPPLLNYRILRRTETGEYVESQQPFATTDSLRLAIRVEERTDLRIAAPDAVLWSGTAFPGRETLVFIPPKTTLITVTGSGVLIKILLTYR